MATPTSPQQAGVGSPRPSQPRRRFPPVLVSGLHVLNYASISLVRTSTLFCKQPGVVSALVYVLVGHRVEKQL